MSNPRSITQEPVITEKATILREGNKYAFRVDSKANKIQIRQAVESLFDVKVKKVNVRNRRGKRKRVGRSVGFGKDTRHAVVTLAAGDKLDIY